MKHPHIIKVTYERIPSVFFSNISLTLQPINIYYVQLERSFYSSSAHVLLHKNP